MQKNQSKLPLGLGLNWIDFSLELEFVNAKQIASLYSTCVDRFSI